MTLWKRAINIIVIVITITIFVAIVIIGTKDGNPNGFSPRERARMHNEGGWGN